MSAKKLAILITATLLTSSLTDVAKRRVSALQRFSELGAGFQLATLDLEIRGAGNLLGSKQSGHVKEVGLELFSEMLTDAIAKLQGQEPIQKTTRCEMKVGIPAYLPGFILHQH